jgi:alcohol dehydrogenase, propanol-preferring
VLELHRNIFRKRYTDFLCALVKWSNSSYTLGDMHAQILTHPAPISTAPLTSTDLSIPNLADEEVLIRVLACGVCHTDLHLAEGDLPAKHLPLVPGHQVIGIVEQIGAGVNPQRIGERVGVPWLHSTCGNCEFCNRGDENLCPHARFTGWDADGGFAEYIRANANFVMTVPACFSDIEAAPLLCAGVIGFRSVRLAGCQPREHIGLFGFGASAHLTLPVLRHWDCAVSVFTRGADHRAQALALGAGWAGFAEDAPPTPLDRAILFAPAGELVPLALGKLRPGGVLVINAIHMSPVPTLPYSLLYGERVLRTVANATRQDASDFLSLAERIGIHVDVEPFPLKEANIALQRLKEGRIRGAAVLSIGETRMLPS